MIPSIYDNPEARGIEIEFDMENSMAIRLFMSDYAAQQMINIIQNKLNARI